MAINPAVVKLLEKTTVGKQVVAAEKKTASSSIKSSSPAGPVKPTVPSKPTSPSSPTMGPVAPRPGETKEQYTERITPQPTQPISRGGLAKLTFLQQMEQDKQYRQTQAVLKQRTQNIKPEEQYVMQTEGTSKVGPVRAWSKGQILTGKQIQDIYGGIQAENTQNIKDYRKGSQESIKTITGYPQGTTFTKTDEGYDVNIPESAKLEQAKTAIGQYEKLPPGLSQIALTGYYLESNFLSMGKPIADIFGKTKEYNIATSFALASGGALPNTKDYARNMGELIKTTKYDVHYPSGWDIAFEPLGMSPKGSIDILKRHPIEATVGNIGAEAASWIGFSGVAKAGTKAATKTFTYVAPKISSVGSRINLEFAGAFGRFVPKGLKGTTVIKNIGLYTKGYRPALVMAPGKTIIGKEAATLGEGTIGKVVTQKTPYALSLERKFLSKEAYDVATKNLATKLSTRSIDIGFPTKQYVGRQGYIVSSMSKEYYQTKGVLSKTLVKKAEYSTIKKPVKEIGDWFVITDKQIGKSGSLYNVGKPTKFIPPVESEIISPIQKKYYMTRGINKPVPKKWITDYREPFLKNTRAQQQLIEPQLMKLRTEIQTGGKIISSIVLPEQIGNLSVATKIFSYDVLRGSKRKEIYAKGELNLPDTRQNFENAPKFSMRTIADNVVSRVKQGRMSLELPDVKKMSVTETRQASKMSMRDLIRMPTNQFTMRQTIPFVPFAFMPSLTGGGEGGRGSDDWDRYFRKRKFNIGSINQAFGIGMKPMKIKGGKKQWAF